MHNKSKIFFKETDAFPEWCFGTRKHRLPVFKFCFEYTFKLLKILDDKFNGYISKFYTLTKSFHGKLIFLVSCVKKMNFG
jgi:hypothetical protein